MILGLEMTDDDQDAIDPLVFGPDQLVEELLEAAIQEPVEVTS